MTLYLLDHVIAALLVLVFPVADYIALRDRAARIRAGETGLRMAIYRKFLREEWIGAAVVVAAWFALGRGAADLGLVGRADLPALVGYALAAIVCIVLVVQARTIIGNPEREAAIREQLGLTSFLMPHTARERSTFDAVSVTAGICEEVVFRGFLIAYVIALLGVPFWIAGLLSSVVFGLAHSYQGPVGAAKCGVVGLLMALLYGLTGALWAPILVHAVMDLTSGRIGFAASSNTPLKNAA